MKIESQVSAYLQSGKQVTSAKGNGGISSYSKNAEEAKATLPAESTSVSISGRALMLSRLFHTEDSTTEPPVLSGSKGMSEHGLMLPHNFLTQGDRKLLAEMYEFADEQGADLEHVDRLAWDLGLYRQRDNGKAITSFNDGRSYDLEGRVRTVSFTEKDAATAERVLQSDALNSTKLDQGFLSYILDPGYGYTHASDFEFLEQMVVRFSSRSSEVAALDSKFSTSVRLENNYIIQTTDEVALHKPSLSVVSDEERTAADVASLKFTKQNLNEWLLESFFGKSDEKVSERGLLSRVIELFKISNSDGKK